MSNNIESHTKKLALKAELIRHIETATTMAHKGEPSSVIKVFTLHLDMAQLEYHDVEPNLEEWQEWLAR